MAVIDLKMKTAQGDTPNFLFNPRGKNFDFRSYDAYDRTDPSWTCSFDPINDLAELQMVGDPEGHGFWGDGYNASEGTSNVVPLRGATTPAHFLGSTAARRYRYLRLRQLTTNW